MAKMISERASTSTDIPSTPDSMTGTTHVQQLADNMYDKVAAYLQGQIESITHGILIDFAEASHSNKFALPRRIPLVSYIF